MKNHSSLLLTATRSAAMLVIAIGSLTSCTKSSSSSNSSADSTADSAAAAKGSVAKPAKAGASADTATAAPELAGVKVQPGTATDSFVGARTDISDLSCKADGKGTWNVEGSVKNSTNKAVNYRIYTSFLNGTETLGLIETDIDNVKADATKKWSGSMTIGAEKVDCVLRVERVQR
jgi:hypothetical protein